MNFPANIETLQARIVASQNAAREISAEIARLERQLRQLQEITKILEGLLTSWKESDARRRGRSQLR
jgi:prefoldin subunit 5